MDEFQNTLNELDATLEKAQELVKRLGQLLVHADRIDARGILPRIHGEIGDIRCHPMKKFVSELWNP